MAAGINAVSVSPVACWHCTVSVSPVACWHCTVSVSPVACWYCTVSVSPVACWHCTVSVSPVACWHCIGDVAHIPGSSVAVVQCSVLCVQYCVWSIECEGKGSLWLFRRFVLEQILFSSAVTSSSFRHPSLPHPAPPRPIVIVVVRSVSVYKTTTVQPFQWQPFRPSERFRAGNYVRFQLFQWQPFCLYECFRTGNKVQDISVTTFPFEGVSCANRFSNNISQCL